MRLIDADALSARIMTDAPDFMDGGSSVTKAFILAMINTKSVTPTIEYAPWVNCEERMPEKCYGCLVTVWDTNPVTEEVFANLLPYFVGWDGEQWNDEEGKKIPFEVIAWMKLPNPYHWEDRR